MHIMIYDITQFCPPCSRVFSSFPVLFWFSQNEATKILRRDRPSSGRHQVRWRPTWWHWSWWNLFRVRRDFSCFLCTKTMLKRPWIHELIFAPRKAVTQLNSGHLFTVVCWYLKGYPTQLLQKHHLNPCEATSTMECQKDFGRSSCLSKAVIFWMIPWQSTSWCAHEAWKKTLAGWFTQRITLYPLPKRIMKPPMGIPMH